LTGSRPIDEELVAKSSGALQGVRNRTPSVATAL
jgi:hypothetical protein